MLVKGAGMKGQANEGVNKRAAFYLELAAEARGRAVAKTEFAARKTMLQVAEMWEAMALSADRTPNSN